MAKETIAFENFTFQKKDLLTGYQSFTLMRKEIWEKLLTAKIAVSMSGERGEEGYSITYDAKCDNENIIKTSRTSKSGGRWTEYLYQTNINGQTFETDTSLFRAHGLGSEAKLIFQDVKKMQKLQQCQRALDAVHSFGIE